MDIVRSLTNKVAHEREPDTGIERCIYCRCYILDLSGRTAIEHTPFCPWRLGKELAKKERE